MLSGIESAELLLELGITGSIGGATDGALVLVVVTFCWGRPTEFAGIVVPTKLGLVTVIFCQ